MFQVFSVQVSRHITLLKQRRQTKVSEKVRNKNVTKCERSRLHVYPQRPPSSCFHNMQYYQETWHCGQKRKLDRSQQRKRASLVERQRLSQLLHRLKLTSRRNMCQFIEQWQLSERHLVWTEALEERHANTQFIFESTHEKAKVVLKRKDYLPSSYIEEVVLLLTEKWLIKLLKHFINQCLTY